MIWLGSSSISQKSEHVHIKFLTLADFLSHENISQGAQTAVDVPQKSPDSKTCIFWCKTTWGTMFTKGTLPLMGESM